MNYIFMQYSITNNVFICKYNGPFFSLRSPLHPLPFYITYIARSISFSDDIGVSPTIVCASIPAADANETAFSGANSSISP